MVLNQLHTAWLIPLWAPSSCLQVINCDHLVIIEDQERQEQLKFCLLQDEWPLIAHYMELCTGGQYLEKSHVCKPLQVL